ncbi:MAG: amidohydrolase family protein [Alphaproteobacteria bacterium]|nr:amidohydrolase family protein [Alphaproteobacteria bacterium]
MMKADQPKATATRSQPIHFRNVKIFDGLSDKLFDGEVLVQGNRIKEVSRKAGGIQAKGAEVIDGGGATLMPGLINTHCHMSYCGPQNMGHIPVEEHMMITARQAKVIIDHGTTAAIGAGSAKPRLDIVIRNEINAGYTPGPRYLACTPEITVTGGLGDSRQLHFYHNELAHYFDGPHELRRIVREYCREGVDVVKLMLSGDHLIPGFCDADQTAMDEDEVAIGTHIAHQRSRKLNCHARNPESIKRAVKYGIHLIYHATLADEESLDLLEANKDKHWVVPAIGFTYATAYEAGDFGIPPETAEKWGFVDELAKGAETMKKLHKRGVRVLPFGDYGFPWTPHGTETRDFEHFQKMLGFKPHEILRAATAYGAEAFGKANELGQVKAGYLADLVMLDGNPLQDLTLFRDQATILMIMKDGQYHKAPQARRKAVQRQAAE